MSFLASIGFELGIGIAAGMLAGSTGTIGSARGRMTLLAAGTGFAVGCLLAGDAEMAAPLGGLICLIGAVFGCLVISELICATTRRRTRSGVLGFLIWPAALMVVVLASVEPALVWVVVIALAWLGLSRQRRGGGHMRPAHRGPSIRA